MTQRVLITGSDGFVGSALCPLLEQRGYHLHRGVQLFPGVTPPDAPDVFANDIGPDTNWDAPLQGVDAVIHLAARVHVMRETAPDPLATFRQVNTEGTARLARAAVEHGVRRFIFLSTIGVNGSMTPVNKPFHESSPVAPHNAYAQSKWEAEQILRDIQQGTGLEVIILRAPLVYGPGVPGNMLRLLKLVDRGFPLPLGNSGNRRSLLSRTNLASVLHHCIEHPQAAGETFLVSDGVDLSTTELIRKIAHHLDQRVWLFPVPVWAVKTGGQLPGKAHMVSQLWGSLVVDSSKARQKLDWQPPFSIDDELALMAKWFKGQRHAD